MKELYESPLNSRYASTYMLNLFSSKSRAVAFRKLWLSLAKAEKELGLPITDEQIKDLEAHVEDIDFDVISKKEAEIRHDVMAHIYAYGEAAKSAKGIIHLGATSCYVTDNADLYIYKNALIYIRNELVKVVKNLASFANKYKSVPTVGYTHYQVAQFVTVGKRATLWMQDFVNDIEEIDNVISSMKFLGCRGAVGTEASFLDLFNGDSTKIDRLNELIMKDFGFDKCFDVCGQTYPRKQDMKILNALSLIGQSAYKMANDIRLLQHDHQIEEPFESKQVGSSAMAYKRNPMRSERICSLSRYLFSDVLNASMTASTQWLERTLDDSAIRRISMPEGFLVSDSIIRLCQNITSNLVVNEVVIAKACNDALPFIATENILMEATKKGGDRQALHEIIRTCSMEASKNVKDGLPCNLLDLLLAKEELGLTKEELENTLNPNLYIGRSIEQVDRYLKVVEPLIKDVEVSDSDINL